MPRKKTVPAEEVNPGLENPILPEGETAEGMNGFPEDLSVFGGEETETPEPEATEPFQESVGEEEASQQAEEAPDVEQETGEANTTSEDAAMVFPEIPADADAGSDPEAPSDTTLVSLDSPSEPEEVPESKPEEPSREPEPADDTASEVSVPVHTPPPKSDRQSFYDLNFNVLDRDLTAEERQEWNSIYASYRGRSALSGTIIGVDPHSISVRNRQTGQVERQTMYCAIVIPYRVRVVIPAAEMWEAGHERPDFVLQNMVGATIDFIITKVDRESGFAIGSRRLAARSQRYFFAHRESLRREGARLKCRVLSVGPRRCLVECYGHDINMTQRDLRYTAIPDLRNEYHPGQELECIVKGYDPEKEALRISVKETESNPFEGAELRHPVGSRRQAVIAGKYGGGVFCNLPDGAVCMCSYSYQHEDSDFMVGDTVILVIQRHEREKRQMYGKILSKW